MTENRKLDVRTAERHIRKGTLERKTYETHLAGLPDLEEASEFVDYAAQFKAEEREAAEEAESAEAAVEQEVAQVVADVPEATPSV